MKKNNILLISAISLIVLLICSALFLLSIRERIPPNIFCFLDIGTYRIPPNYVEVNSSNTYGQSFISNFDNLFMFSIFIPRQNFNSDGELYFHLKSNRNAEDDLVTLKWKFKDIRFRKNDFYIIPPDRETTDKGFHFHFQFPPISNAKNKEFYLYFASPDSKAGEGIKLGLWDDIDYYEGLRRGEAFRNSEPLKGFLAFRTYNTWSQDKGSLINKIKTNLFQDKPFFIFYCTLLSIVLSAIIIVSL